jgi:hypothetical protein
MSLTLRATLLVLFFSVCAEAQPRTMAVYAGSAQAINAEARAAMHGELQRLLAPAGFDVVLKNSSERQSGEDFEVIVVASFTGSCSNSAPAVKPVAATLGDTSIADGHILPFFRVDCGLIMQMLGPQADPSAIGKALGRVMAHEIYHIAAHTTDHHDTGVAKAAFSTRDLTTTRFDFDSWSLSRMRPVSIASSSESSGDAAGR